MHALHLTSCTVQALVEGDQSRGGAVGAWWTFLRLHGAARAVEAGRALVRLLAQIRRGAVGVLATEIAETGCDVTHVRTRKIYVMLHQHTCTKTTLIANDAVSKLTPRCRCRCSQSAPLRHSRSRPGTGYSRIPSPDRCGSSTYLAGTGTRTRCVCRPDTSNLYSLTIDNAHTSTVYTCTCTVHVHQNKIPVFAFAHYLEILRLLIRSFDQILRLT